MSSGPYRRLGSGGVVLCLAALLPLSARAQKVTVNEEPAQPVPVPYEPEPSDDSVIRTTGPSQRQGSGPLDISVWGRLGNNVATAVGNTDAFVDAEVNLMLSGKVLPYLSWQADFVATYGPGNFGAGADPTGGAHILDLIAKFDLADGFNVWFGRMLVPSDRSNVSGTWFMSPWHYPGGYIPGAVPVGPRAGDFGRSDGVTAWGQLDGGVIKYYAGVYDLGQPAESPLYTGRINLSLWNPEPGYYHSSTYYGGKDVAALGASAQYKKNGSLPPPTAPMELMLSPDTFTGFSVDFLIERTFSGKGTIDLEGAAYFFSGAHELIDFHAYGLVSYLVPQPIGWGKLQPLVRVQQATPKGTSDRWTIFDAQLGYAMQEYAARLALGYQRISAGSTNDLLFLGIQIQR
jgi:hypothetical protein